ncbi:MAG: hypothetical protein P1V97_26540 [Planctomycetota bacterium]|nr:hypothetical protein [Planctomycetota bacterium]
MTQQEKIYSERFEKILQHTQITRPHENPTAIPSILSMMNDLQPQDFSLSTVIHTMNRDWDWTTTNLFAEGDINAGLFMVPKGHRIPLHDHPQMTVFFRVLWGHLELKAYDWDQRFPFEGLANPRSHVQLDGASQTQLVRPELNNIHAILALSDCAFVDLFAPPYCADSGRSCSNYREKAWVQRGGEKLMQLERVPSS